MMKAHLLTLIVLLLALACHVAGLTGLGKLLFFLGAALGIGTWLQAVQSPRRDVSRLLMRIQARR